MIYHNNLRNWNMLLTKGGKPWYVWALSFFHCCLFIFFLFPNENQYNLSSSGTVSFGYVLSRGAVFSLIASSLGSDGIVLFILFRALFEFLKQDQPPK